MLASDRTAPVALSLVFFLSGCSALLFETLWFRQMGLVLGNAVWSSTLVLSGFMAGLALGSGLAARFGRRVAEPLRAFAALELVVGGAGFGLVATLPALPHLLAPLLRSLLENPWALNATRLITAFVLLLLPSVAMGATLPILTRALTRRGHPFGSSIGRLYGWNTLGAALGSMAGELWLIEALGLRATGAVAGSLNLVAASVATALARRPAPGPDPEPDAAPRPRGDTRLLLAAGLSGAVLLALEVVWFRFLLLTVYGTSLTFAVMLAVVLVGIGAGGVIAGSWARRSAEPQRALPLVALGAGAITALAYGAFHYVLPPPGRLALSNAPDVLRVGAALMLPTCVASGLLFTLLATAVKARGLEAARAAGRVTVANTLGAMVGAALGGFVLLPRLGLERSFFVLSLAYALVAVGTLPGAEGRGRRFGLALGSLAAVFLASLALFPFGLMERRYVPAMVARFQPLTEPGVELLATREGLTETIAYVRLSRWDTPVQYRLLTNSISMSAWNWSFARYMLEFVYLPVAVNPSARRALLISYGVGATAKALTDTPSLESIDVVDISRDILELAPLVFPPPAVPPLADPRVRVHVEDGRFFLLTRRQRWDIITGEPPPPTSAGIASLYSREYFGLMRERLEEGGVATYWLPCYQVTPSATKAIVGAFCAAFPDCSLWSGFGPEWILMGTRGAPPVQEEAFTRQWRRPGVLATLRAFAYEKPEHLGTTFIADAPALAEWARGVEPVDDDHPLRIPPRSIALPLAEEYLRLADPPVAAARFRDSDFIRRLWPPALRERTQAAFAEQSALLRVCWQPYGRPSIAIWDIYETLAHSDQRTALLWLFGIDVGDVRAARAAADRGQRDPRLERYLALSVLAERRYLDAERLLAEVQPHSERKELIAQLRVIALSLAGEPARAARLVQETAAWLQPRDRAGWTWLLERLRIPDPFPVQGTGHGGKPASAGGR